MATPLRVPGATLHCEFVSAAHEAALLAAVNAAPWNCELKRRTQHYGYKYDYKARTALQRIGDLPEWAMPIVSTLCEEGGPFASAPPNQLIVNEYEPGQGIAPHTDARVFGDTIVSLSLGADVVMDFRRGEEHHAVALPRRSLLVLRGAVRATWTHGIAPRRSDGGARRAIRISLTFRVVPPQN